MSTPTLLLAALVAATLTGDADAERVVVGEAFDLETGVPVFVEEHRERWQDGRPVASRVTFRSPAGDLLSEKWFVYGDRPGAPAYESLDPRSGAREAALPAGDAIELAWQARSGAGVRRGSPGLPTATVVDAGIYRFIDDHWDRLVAGESVALEMAVASRLGFVSFRLRRAAAESVAAPSGADETVTFELTAASFLVRLALDPLRFTYSVADRRLLEFAGRTGVLDDSGRPIHARERFLGGAPAVRHSP